MPSSKKTWNDFTPKYRRELAQGIADTVMEKTASVEEAKDFLTQVVLRIETQIGNSLPAIVGKIQDDQPLVPEDNGTALVQALGDMRREHGHHNSQLHLPKISVHQLDIAVASAGFSHKNLQTMGYTIGRAQFSNAVSKKASHTIRGVGRKTKLHNEECINLVGKVLQKYGNDSSKVVCISKDNQKILVCAKLLSKNKWRIFKAETVVRAAMSWTTFRKIHKLYFPHYRKPQRKTDTCSHCRTLKRKIVPRAMAEYKKRRTEIVEHCPDYFQALDSAPDFAALVTADRGEDVVLEARRYINLPNARSSADPARQDMSLATRMALFEAEARAAHKLKGHCELLDAYLWHRASGDRQRDNTAHVLEQLKDTEAYFHFDFKENVRYPMSKDETGDEWHAQNKLSLTVFGCQVHTPGRRDTNFLLVTEVLDHDSQIARLLLTQILETVASKESYQWGKVKMLHLVCDCGPHFRSRESYAFFLHDLPKKWNINDAWLLHGTCF